MGLYTYKAVETALANSFRKKGSQPEPYIEQPLFKTARESKQPLTEEDKLAQVKALFDNLEAMQRSFEATHGDKNNA